MDTHTARVNVLGIGISATSMNEAVAGLLAARTAGEKGYVCVTSVHGVMESQADLSLRRIHNRSLMTVPDGMPTVWMGREYGFIRIGRVYGPELMLAVCAQTAALNQKAVDAGMIPGKKQFTHFLYGSTDETLCKLKANLEAQFPGIQITGSYAPPFRPLTEEEECELQQRVAACKPDFFWVGLSTPKQEKFMAAHAPALTDDSADHSPARHPLDCGILLGVGAAFDIHAGNYKDAPDWIKMSGLQWLYRLCKEPRRLWRRYLWIVPGFIWLSFLQVMGMKKWTIENEDS